MEVVCIEDDGTYLTVGRKYQVESEHNGWYRIINDMGKLGNYPSYYSEDEE